MAKESFRDDLTTLINQHCRENDTDTPDYVLATYIENCLNAYTEAVKARDKFYGITMWKNHQPIKPNTDFDEITYGGHKH